MELIIRDLGQGIDYEECYQRMERFTLSRDEGTPDEFWLLEHKPVYTKGVRSKDEVVARNKIPVVQSNRGGLVTYHGPGQLVGYLLLDLRRMKMGIRDLVCATEDLLLQQFARYGIEAHRIQGAPGLYVDNAKIAAMGFRVNNGRSYHGFSVNVDMDLSPYENINACGLNLASTMVSHYYSEIVLEDFREELIYRWLGWYDGYYGSNQVISNT